MKIIKLNQRYVDFSNPNTKIVGLQSAKNTGKTTWTTRTFTFIDDKTIEKVSNILFIIHRIALGKDISLRNKTAYYKDGKSAYTNPRLTICLDSLPALFYNEVHIGTTIVIDEATQVFRHLHGGTLKKSRQQVYNTLSKLLRNAKQIILMDADLDEITIRFFADLAGCKDEDITWVINEYNPKDKVFNEFPSKNKNDLLLKLLLSVKEGKKCYVACDSKVLVKLIERLLNNTFPDTKILAVHGDNSSNEKESEFICDINNKQLDYQVVIASPTLFTGVDIKDPHFEEIYLFATGAGSTSTDLLQATARVRTIKEVNFWVTTRVRKEETDWQVIFQQKEKAAFDFEWSCAYQYKAGKWNLEDKFIMDSFCKLLASNNADTNNLKKSFIRNAKKEGKVILVELTEDYKKAALALGQRLKEMKKDLKKEHIDSILKAVDISKEEYFINSKYQDTLNEEERKSQQKHKLLEAVGYLEEHLPYAVENEKTIYKKAALMEWLHTDDSRLAEVDKRDNDKSPTDRKYRVYTKALIKEFLDKIGYWESVEKGAPLKSYYEDFSIEEFCLVKVQFTDWAEKLKDYIKEYLGVTVTKDVNKKPFQTIQAILRALGLQATNKQLRVEGKRYRNYYACKEAHDRMFAIGKTRAALREEKVTQEEKEYSEIPF